MNLFASERPYSQEYSLTESNGTAKWKVSRWNCHIHRHWMTWYKLFFHREHGHIQTVSHLKIYYPFLSRFRSTCIIVIWKLQIIFHSAGNCFPVTLPFSASPQTIQLVWEQTQSLRVKGDFFFPIIHTNKTRVEKFSKEWAAELVHPACLDRWNDESWNKLEKTQHHFQVLLIFHINCVAMTLSLVICMREKSLLFWMFKLYGVCPYRYNIATDS